MKARELSSLQKVYLGAAMLALIGGAGAFAASSFFSGTVTGNVTVTSTTTAQAAILGISSATANGSSCAINSATSATCSGFSIGQAATAPFTVQVCNTGNIGASVTVTGTTTLSGASLTTGTPTQTVPAGGCTGWSLTYTAGQTAGIDSVTMTVSA